MKTAISVPDDTFEQATQRAEELGISRSEFFARAARRYLDELSSRSLTRQIDEALQSVNADDSADAAVAAGRRRLADESGWLSVVAVSAAQASVGRQAADTLSGGHCWWSSASRTVPDCSRRPC